MAGVHTATWGMYKDAPHEGFSLLEVFPEHPAGDGDRGGPLGRVGTRPAAGGGPGGALRRHLRGGARRWRRSTRRSSATRTSRSTSSRCSSRSSARWCGAAGARLLAGAGYVAVLLAMVVLVWLDRPTVPDPMPQLAGRPGRRPRRLDQRLRRGLEGCAEGGVPDLQVLPQPDHRVALRARPVLSELRSGAGDPRRDRLLRRDDGDLQDVLLPQRAEGQVRGDAGALSRRCSGRRQPFIFLYAGIWAVVLVALVVALRGVPSPG